MILRRIQDGEFPPHFLYGAAKLGKYGVGVAWHMSRLGLPRWRMMLRNSWRILRCREPFDAIYATHYRGIEPIVMLRALGLYRKPVIVWHHQPVVTPEQRWREALGRIFYRGFDRMIFFSRQLIATSLRSPKARPERVVEGHWGGCLEFYDRIAAQARAEGSPHGFISTGKELRDMPTLVEAFGRTGEPLKLVSARQVGSIDYEKVFAGLDVKPNISVDLTGQLTPFDTARLVARAACVVICCQKSKYTVGLTTLVEALALGKPIITTRNETFPIDVEKEHCGISVPYGDVDAWEKAIRYMASHPAEAARMGMNSRRLALEAYNDEDCAREMAALIRQVVAAHGAAPRRRQAQGKE